MSQAPLTPTEKAAVMQAAKLKSKNQLTTSAPKSDALKNQVWMSEKNPCKRAASNIAEPDVPKQAQIRNKSPPPVNWRLEQESGAPWSAAQLFDSDSNGNESDNKLEESDEDIQGLDSKKLKATLDYERPLFAPHDKTNGGTISVNSHSWANSSTSSMRSIANTPSDSDNNGLGEDKGLTSKNLSGPRYRPLKQKVTKPTWCTPEVDHTISDGPPADEQLEVTVNDSGKVNLTDQQAHIQDMIRASITCLHKHLLFKNAYPELQQRRKLMADILMSCTKDGEEFDAVRKRLAKDPKYPKGRIGSIHRNVRKAAQAHVASHYQLMKGADERVAELLKNNAYIYPVNTKDHHDEVELPVAMVALASAAVCFNVCGFVIDIDGSIMLLKYSSEKYDRNFNSEMYGGIYQTLVQAIVSYLSIKFLDICSLMLHEASSLVSLR
ncbi:uncharacterized protein EDB91DRAFT_1082096 [Suillus paluster]|uniref:uncharacterized protein n=1 Tax=Suillus paluster TaxID=48578 RepID=UPI001B87635D|nr:uncharacterized protein EDB91DRAFT_1082096 [Suillus paluster]KAG1740115.1 hypothetical protein EDB91DRAFT_1082096 [Suillus paluster]